jgi:hypothetical protein
MGAAWVEAIASAVQAVALVVAGIWAYDEVKKYRARQSIIQLDLDAHIYALDNPVSAVPITWEAGATAPTELARRSHPYALEVSLWFRNKGKTRFWLYNAQVGINAIVRHDEAHFTSADGHFHFNRVVTSGNIVTEFRVKNRPLEETSRFYIEPGVDQLITYVTLLPDVGELIQIEGKFSLAQTRIFPAKDIADHPTLYPHNVARTYQIKNGELLGRT